jgi:hypothetical protein
MLFLKGERSVIQTINVLSKPYQKKNTDPTFDTLKSSYQKLLGEIQPWIPHSKENKTEYVTDFKVIKKWMEVFSTESLADDTFYDMEQARQSKAIQILNRTMAAASKLGEKCPEFMWVYNLAMDSVFNVSSKIASGGTTSAAVGVLFVDPRDHYTEEDIYELLVHELGHTLLFLHEWRFGLFNNVMRLPEPQTFALSAIRNQMRPFDKAIHSVLVSIEVLLLRERVLGHNQKRYLHPPTDELVPMIENSIESITFTDNKEKMLTEFGKNILADCKNEILKFKERNIENVIFSGK